jgi:prevent-host-death family protein
MEAVTGPVVGVRELRNNVSGVLRRVEAGQRITISVSGRPVAELRPLTEVRWTPRAVVERILRSSQADPQLTADLAELAGEELEDLPR